MPPNISSQILFIENLVTLHKIALDQLYDQLKKAEWQLAEAYKIGNLTAAAAAAAPTDATAAQTAYAAQNKWNKNEVPLACQPVEIVILQTQIALLQSTSE